MNHHFKPKKDFFKRRFSVIFTLLFVYVLLFEFILPVNNILPRPSILIESIQPLFVDYGLLSAMAITTSIVYLSIIIAYFLIQLFFPMFVLAKGYYPHILDAVKVFKFIPAFFAAIIFVYWFSDSLFAEFLFAVLASGFFLKVRAFELIENVEPQYLEAAKSLGISGSKISRQIVWKSIQPSFFDGLKRLHYYLWVLLLVYEFIGAAQGFGGLYHAALVYQDLAVLVLLALLVSFLIWLGDFLIDYVNRKLIVWES